MMHVDYMTVIKCIEILASKTMSQGSDSCHETSHKEMHVLLHFTIKAHSGISMFKLVRTECFNSRVSNISNLELLHTKRDSTMIALRVRKYLILVTFVVTQ